MFDLHSHSVYSDGTETPSKVVDIAKESGLSLFALTDHDSIAGVKEAIVRAKEVSLNLLTGCEMEVSFYAVLHLLCLGMDIDDPGFKRVIERQREYRLERNDKLTKLLYSLGYDVAPALNTDCDCVTRAHFAAALVRLGYASSMNDAYRRILGQGCPGYVKQERLSPKEVIDCTKNAGGIVVLAHPMQMKCEPAPMVDELVSLGIWGIEAHYYNATPGETRLFTSLGKAHGLNITCGSDFHGSTRPEAVIGGCYDGCDELKRTEEKLYRLFF